MKWKFKSFLLIRLVRETDCKLYLIVHRIECVFHNSDHPAALSHFHRNFRRRISQSGNTLIRRSKPKALRKLGPPLMHIGETTGIPGQRTKYNIRTIMKGIFIEVMNRPRYLYLIGLLEILFMHEIVRYLRGKRIEGYLFQMIRKRQVAGNLHHLLQRKHHLHCRTKLGALCRNVAVQPFITSVHTLRLSVIMTEIGKGFLHCLQVFLIGILLIINNRFFDSLSQIHAMDAVLTGKVIPMEEHIDKVITLLMQ